MRIINFSGAVLLLFLSVGQLAIADEKYPFSRLFTTHTDRIYLDNLKNQIDTLQDNKNTTNTVSDVTTSTSVNTKETPDDTQKDTILRLSGFIKRADGQQQLWINEKKLINSDHLSGQLSSGKKAVINLKTKKKKTAIKVGQSWDPPTDEIIHVYKQE